MCEQREITCEECGGDGRFEACVGHAGGEPVYASAKCGLCDGKGRYLVDVEPITLEDLDSE